MIFLLLSIICATFLLVILKWFVRFEIPQHYGIVYNYLFCSIIGWISAEDIPPIQELTSWNGFIPSLSLGILFISIFNLIAISSKYLGVGITSISFKLSFIIPVISAIVIHKEPLHLQTIAAILFSVAAVLVISFNKSNTQESKQKSMWWLALLPVIIFLGAGANDAVFNYLQVNYLPDGYDHILTSTIFTGAFLTGFIFLFYKKDFWTPRYMLAGLGLAIPNYASLYFLLLGLKYANIPYSLLFPGNNLGIILLGVFLGIVIFKEKPGRNTWIGLALAVMALTIIALG